VEGKTHGESIDTPSFFAHYKSRTIEMAIAKYPPYLQLFAYDQVMVLIDDSIDIILCNKVLMLQR